MQAVPNPPLRSFTARCDKLSRVLLSEVQVGEPFEPVKEPPPKDTKKFIAIWDTGASNSVISQAVVSSCGLKPTGMAKVHTANDDRVAATYLISVWLPNSVCFTNLRVTEGTIGGSADMLIGMDIIGQGDFAVTNYGGNTTFSFRVPSCECIDFVKNRPGQSLDSGDRYPGTSRSAPCPCGSGKSYKRCCGEKAPPKH
ncbi:MAG: retroviral-like aspartic protease family protein [Dehalococcoidia bacterium]|nr:retroviral-like aspartic protease family protein [Dehalococcoidia bacterium]